MELIDEIKNLKALLDQAAITTEEFNTLKKKLLSVEFDSGKPQETASSFSIQNNMGSQAVFSNPEVFTENKIISSDVNSIDDGIPEKFGIPLWVGWVINIAAWVLFIATFNHGVEILMGLASCFAFYIGLKNKHDKLKYASIFDAIWMFAWGLGLFNGYY